MRQALSESDSDSDSHPPKALLAAALILSTACGAAFAARRGDCYGDTPARVGRDVPDEEFAYAHALYRRYEAMRPMHRAAMLPVLQAWSPDVSDLYPGADCTADLAVRSEREFFGQDPIAFSRLQIARVRALSRGWDGRLSLLRVADLRDDQIAPYAAEPEETGPPPPRNALRRAALLGMHSGLVMNDSDVRAYALRTLHESDDAWEQLALLGVAHVIFMDALWGHPNRMEGADGGEARALFRERLRHLRARVDGPPDRSELELAIRWLPILGYYGVRAGGARALRALANRIAERRGELPIAQGIEGGARDLAIAAAFAIAHLDYPDDNVASFSIEPPPSREVFSVHEEPWLTVVAWRDRTTPEAEAARAAHLAQLERDLDSMRYFRTRCHVMSDMIHWAKPEDAQRIYELVRAPLAAEGPITLTTEAACRIGVLARIRGPIDPDRIAFLISLYDLPPERIGPQDLSLDEHHAAIAYSIQSSLRPTVVHALASRTDLIDHAELRAFVQRIEAQPLLTRDDIDSHEAHAAVGFHALTQAWLRWSIANEEPGARDAARALVAEWIESMPERLNAPPTGAVYAFERSLNWLYSIGAYAPAFGLDAEAQAMIELARSSARPWMHVVLDVIEFMLGLPVGL